MLTLHCDLHPGALPLLARLPRLRHLTLHLTYDRGTEDWSSASTVGAALLPLLLGAPSLNRVPIVLMSAGGGVDAEDVDYLRLLIAVEDGVLWLRAQLRRLGRDPRMVGIKS